MVSLTLSLALRSSLLCLLRRFTMRPSLLTPAAHSFTAWLWGALPFLSLLHLLGMFAMLRTIGTLRLLPHLLPRLLRPFDLLPGALVLLRLGLLGTPSLRASALIGLVLRLEPGLLAIWLVWFLRLAVVFGFCWLGAPGLLPARLLLVGLLWRFHPLLSLSLALLRLLRFLFTSSLVCLLLVCFARIPSLFGLLSILFEPCPTRSALGLPLVATRGRALSGRIGLTSLLSAGRGSLGLARSLRFETGRRNVLRVFFLHRLL